MQKGKRWFPKQTISKAGAAALLLLAGCTVGPSYKTPTSWSPVHWFQAPQAPADQVWSRPVAQTIPPDWWAVFGDPELTALERRAATANFDVLSATIRLAESRERRRITAADAFPEVNGDVSYTREKPSPYGEFSLLGAGASSGAGANSGGATGVPSSSPLAPFDLWQYGFDASWELDLWGRVRRSVEAADATIESSRAARRDIMLSTMAEVARDYLQLRGIQKQIAIAEDNDRTARQSLRLTEEQAAHGLASQLDVASASAEEAGIAASLPQLAANEAAAINQLSFLLALPPRSLAAELGTPAPVPPVPPQVPIGLPSDLALRRPDIREADAQLHAATAEIGVAEAAFYPEVTLSGSDDIQALDFTNLGNWEAHTYSFGPSISIPIFQGGRLRGNLTLTKAAQQEAAIAFQRVVLNAWQEIDNALTAYAEDQRRDRQLRNQANAAARALDLARQQYRAGLTDFLHVLDAQRQVLSAQQQEADSTVAISTDLVALYKALGGGWATPPGKTT